MGKSWDKVKNGLASVAPILGGVLGGPGGGFAGKLIADALGTDSQPDKIEMALASASPGDLLKLRQVEAENKVDLSKLGMQQAIAEAKAEADKIESVNTSLRVETTAEDPWTRRWRPFWGYISGAAFFIITCCIGFFIANAEMAVLKELPSIITSLAILFSIPGAILGVAAWHRGVKQRVEAGEQKTSGLFSAIASRLVK